MTAKERIPRTRLAAYAAVAMAARASADIQSGVGDGGDCVPIPDTTGFCIDFRTYSWTTTSVDVDMWCLGYSTYGYCTFWCDWRTYFTQGTYSGYAVVDGGGTLRDLGALNSGVTFSFVPLDFCVITRLQWSGCWGSGSQSTNDGCIEREGFLAFQASPEDGGFNGWAWVRYEVGADLEILEWAYEDSGDPIVVGDTGMVPSPLHPTIQSAIDAASEGDVIRIAPGVHQEAVDFQGKAITLVGDVEDPSSVVLDGTGLVDASVVKMVAGEGPDSILRGVTIRNGTSGTAFLDTFVGGAIHTLESSPTIEDCVLEQNAAPYGGAIYARKGAPVFRRCVFRDNRADEDGGGFQFSRTEGGVLEDCVFEGNVAGNNGGAIHMFGGNPTLLTLSISGNMADASGGGVSWASTGGIAWLDSVDIHGNAAAAAGALYIEEPLMDLTLSDSVLCGNDPDAVQGGFIDGGGNCESTLCIELDGEITCDDDGCPADYSGNGVVNGTDLGVWLAYAGKPCEPDIPCPGDLDGDGQITGGDLGVLLASWGVCE